MKNLILIMFCVLLVSCKTTTKIVEVPIETIKTEYKYLYAQDSLYVHDSIVTIIEKKGDTVFVDKEKIKYVYKYEATSDTIIRVDSIPVVVEITKEVVVNKPTTTLYIYLCIGRVVIILIVLFLLLNLYKFYRKWKLPC